MTAHSKSIIRNLHEQRIFRILKHASHPTSERVISTCKYTLHNDLQIYKSKSYCSSSDRMKIYFRLAHNPCKMHYEFGYQNYFMVTYYGLPVCRITSIRSAEIVLVKRLTKDKIILKNTPTNHRPFFFLVSQQKNLVSTQNFWAHIKIIKNSKLLQLMLNKIGNGTFHNTCFFFTGMHLCFMPTYE